MKLFNACLTCHSINARSDTPISWIAIPDNGVIEFTCDQGHRTHRVITNERFELLSQYALQAVVDGYYREAVASFAASLERAYEFYCKASGLRSGVPPDEIEKSWKEIRNSSERQLGAFITAWLRDHYASPKLLGQKTVEMRNSVIHKGKFPSESEALDFGQDVADVLLPLLKTLGDGPLQDEALYLRMSRGFEAHKKFAEAGASPITTTQNTLFSAFSGHNAQAIKVAEAFRTLKHTQCQRPVK
jgi:hypothetical protein